ncbi:ATP-binding protein [Vallitalea guaymasensis]|uniref:ATP-binding protein n=1 Tax=Vallitalea guaymasensis TaxID=1185412 RepID=UPI002352F7D9|nr:hypothetical protein [Vallitalea guaymasensis]
MNKNGFFLKELVLKGDNKLDATVSFSTGLNVIDGASDSGKSYIYECIDYMLGGSSTPKDIDEAKGYNDLYLEIHTYTGKIITLFRQLNNSKIYFSLKSILESEATDYSEIIKQHSKDNVENISTILLSAAGIKYKDIIKNKSNITESFTYRTLSRLNMLSEEKIITKDSPINDNGNYTKTKYESALRAILTGRDDADYNKNKSNKVSATRINGQLDLIEKLKKSEKEKLLLLNQNFDDDIQNLIDELENISENTNSHLMEKEEEYKRIHDERLLLSNEVVKDQKLMNRFKLLKKNYESDVKRLDFIDESHFYLKQMADVKCPICNSEWNSSNSPNDEISQMEKSILAEKTKIQLQIDDLDQTMCDIISRIESANSKMLILDEELEVIQKNISETLQPIIQKNNDKIMSLVAKQVEQIEYEDVEKRIEELDKLYSETKDSLNNVKIDNASVNYISDSILSDFTSIINDILIGIRFYSEGKVEFSKNNLDLIVNNKKKDTFGKGSRAIINAAYLLGILKYTENNNLKHPNFILLDSPLTTYKKKDDDLEDSQDVLDNVKANFYEYLNNNFKTNQVIILDNVEPPELLKLKINYIHFTGNSSISRSGFIPV